MTRRAAGLLSCTAAVALALMVVSLQVGGQQKAPAAPPAGSGPRPAAKAPAVTPYELAAMSYAQRFAVLCAPCHGANGRIETPLTPVLAGQPSLYVITQLFLFREGRRSNEAMTAVARTLTDDDLRGFSEFIGTLPPVTPPPPATPPDPIRMARGQALAEQHRCVFCHGAGLGGGQQVPCIGGQHEDYLQASLRGFHSGSRPGYTQAMTEAVSQIPPEDLDTLAYYVAQFRGPAAALTGK
ncbi:MAG: c-type cytochrome [Deltaproteobacteria bacterium]|nr:MAG: c-type cytochrome [Deltaproteobacteria bacterium]TMQ06752.1 MAG: c-type cytochrome [Deltaproteobacteria bacterium]